jgi:hypothetical protein
VTDSSVVKTEYWIASDNIMVKMRRKTKESKKPLPTLPIYEKLSLLYQGISIGLQSPRIPTNAPGI